MSHNFNQAKTCQQTLGDRGEQRVAEYLEQQGFGILERNYKKFYGEIDLIAKKGELISFIEVKTRKKAYFELSQLVTLTKQKKIIKTAESYIAKHRLKDIVFRFDVALIEGLEEKTLLRYIPNAFTKPEFFNYE